MDKGEKKALDDIAMHGCHIIHVLGEDDHPPFSYSIGIQRTSAVPEVVVVGLKQPISHFIVNEYNRRVREGERFRPGDRCSGFIEGFECLVQEVHPVHYKEYFGWNLWLYKGVNFKVLQLVWPTTDGAWPWEQERSESANQQPILAEDGKFHRGKGNGGIQGS